MAYCDDVNVDGIYIEPPKPGVLTDEDSGEEDEGGLADNLSANQLRASAELRTVYPNNDDKLNDNDDDIMATDDDIMATADTEVFKATSSRAADQLVRVDTTILRKICMQRATKNSNVYITEMFEFFFDDEIISHLVSETQKYAIFKNNPTFSVNAQEIKCFIGILTLSGYNTLPGARYHWDTIGDMGKKLVENARRD